MSKKIESKDEAQIIGESELEAVSGGEIDHTGKGTTDCHFVPDNPPQHNGGKDGHVWVKCASSGNWNCMMCTCWKCSQCVNSWHKMEHIMGTIWVPSPSGACNHSNSDKAVRDSSLPVPK